MNNNFNNDLKFPSNRDKMYIRTKILFRGDFMKTTYNKLVRDKIPQLIEESGRKQTSRKLNDEEYFKALIDKVIEEIKEYRETDNEEELADVFEVLDNIVKFKDYEPMHIDYLKIKRKEARGTFDERIFLEEVEDNE
jgi:predicted house-cleaning noncanonical NTP pyrophosphatase (MazG superfamily)